MKLVISYLLLVVGLFVISCFASVLLAQRSVAITEKGIWQEIVDKFFSFLIPNPQSSPSPQYPFTHEHTR